MHILFSPVLRAALIERYITLAMMPFFLAFFVLCFALTGVARRYALWRHALAIPEFRHHHLEPVPRGGGIALVITMITLNLVMYRYRLIDIDTTRSLSFSGVFLLLACVVHNLKPLSLRVRFLLQILAVTLALTWYTRDLIVIVFDSYLYLSDWWMPVLGLLLLAFINLNNVMNEVDGLVASQAFIMIFAAASLLAISGEVQWTIPLILLCAPVLGFLAWNWPPARITMGDAGSSFLGLFISLLGLHLAGDTSINLWVWLILMAVFITDVVTTFLVRARFGLSLMPSSHKNHAYQILARRWDSHFYVTGLLCAICWLWLFPLAYLAMEFEGWGLVLLGLSVLPIAAACLYIGAGREDEVEF
jgi:Fuc2NAc and GlcNAc transferase